jgi:hypothetical protein
MISMTLLVVVMLVAPRRLDSAANARESKGSCPRRLGLDA